MKKDEFLQSLKEIKKLVEDIETLYPTIYEVSNRIKKAMDSGFKLMVCGNGGSAADAQHMAAEFVNRFLKERQPLPALALSTDTSILTSISNDYSFNEVFSKQVEALGNSGDILIGISTSGNSANVANAIKAAKSKGIFCVGLLGKNGGTIKELCDLDITVNSDSTPRIQEMHIFIIHTICQMVEESV